MEILLERGTVMFYIVFLIIWIILSICFILDDFYYVRDEFIGCGFSSCLLMIILALLTTIILFVIFKGIYWSFAHRVDIFNGLIKILNGFIKILIDFKEWVFDV